MCIASPMKSRAAVIKSPTSKTRYSYPQRTSGLRRGGSWWSALATIGSKALGKIGEWGAQALGTAGKKIGEATLKGLSSAIPKGLEAVGEHLFAPSEEEVRTREEEAEFRKQQHQFELEDRRMEVERRRAEEALARKRAQLGQFTSPSQANGEAALIVRGLVGRYPTVFRTHKNYEEQLTKQIAAALLDPENLEDPLAPQKVIGDIELRLAQVEARLNPRAGPGGLEPPPSLRGLKSPGHFRSPVSKRGTGSFPAKGGRGARGGGIAGVRHA